MKRLQKLKKLTEYLVGFRLQGYPDIKPIRVVDQENATGQLTKASGDQVLTAMPEAQDYGRDTDSFSESVSTAIFVLAKINGPARTPELADATYLRLLEIAQAILDKLDEDLSSGTCPLLHGFTLTDLNVIPEYSMFGGWSGWSIEITLG